MVWAQQFAVDISGARCMLDMSNWVDSTEDTEHAVDCPGNVSGFMGESVLY